MAYGHATHGRLAGSGKGILGGFAGALRQLRDRLELWQKRAEERDELKRLLSSSPHLIADVGLTVEQAKERIAKPVWRP